MDVDQLFALKEIKREVVDYDSGRRMSPEDFIKTRSPEKREVTRRTLHQYFHEKERNRQWVIGQLQETLNLPNIVYKYIPASLLKMNYWQPSTLRATQLRVLNDVMECNVSTLKQPEDDEGQWSRALLQHLNDSLGHSMAPKELERRRRLYGDARISTVLQDYLNTLVGVVSLSSDPLITTMWAHYAQNSGCVIGYNTEVLSTLGFEMRRMLYLELAPNYDPIRGRAIRIYFIDEERREGRIQSGVQSQGIPILKTVGFLELENDWKKLARLLFVKGKLWEYEKEVRLLVDLSETRPIDSSGTIRVIDFPVEAIEEVYMGFDTSEEDMSRIREVVGQSSHSWKLKHTSSHAYRMQVTSTGIYKGQN